MARPLKNGIDYFPLDVNFLKNIKTRKILRACGPQSIAVLINLLCNIYQDEGYYMRWDQDAGFLIADDVGVKESLVHEVVKKAVRVDFFDKNLFEKYNILTSIGIQKRYIEATSRRKGDPIDNAYDLVNVNNNELNVNNNELNVCKSTQSKVKESKVNKSKLKDNHLSNTTSEFKDIDSDDNPGDVSTDDGEEIAKLFSSLKGNYPNIKDYTLIEQALSEFSKSEIIDFINQQIEMGKSIGSFAYIKKSLENRREEREFHRSQGDRQDKGREEEPTDDEVYQAILKMYGEDK